MSQNVEVAPLGKAPDSWTAWVRTPFVALSRKPKVMWSILASTALLIVALVFWQNQVSTRDQQAEAELFDAELKLAQLVEHTEKTANAGSKTDEDPVPTRFSWDVVDRLRGMEQKIDLSSATAEIERVAKNFAGSPAAYEALFLLGTLSHIQGQQDAARSYLEQALDQAPDAFASASAALSLGILFEDLKQLDQAKTLFSNALSEGVEALRGEALMALARVSTTTQNYTEARSYYEQLLKELPDSPYAERAQALRDALPGAVGEDTTISQDEGASP